jgi:hypothetical protein
LFEHKQPRAFFFGLLALCDFLAQGHCVALRFRIEARVFVSDGNLRSECDGKPLVCFAEFVRADFIA